MAWFWNSLALQLVLQRHGVSPPGGDFFEAVLMLSVLQCHGVLLFRNRPLALFCGAVGMGAALWSWFLVGSEGNGRHWSVLARRRFRPSVP